MGTMIEPSHTYFAVGSGASKNKLATSHSPCVTLASSQECVYTPRDSSRFYKGAQDLKITHHRGSKIPQMFEFMNIESLRVRRVNTISSIEPTVNVQTVNRTKYLSADTTSFADTTLFCQHDFLSPI